MVLTVLTVLLLGGFALKLVGVSGGAPGLSVLMIALALLLLWPKRSRRIPNKVRRRVRARWEVETGKKFNSKQYELDHMIPFSKRGSHTEDNLNVVERKKNRKKGAKSPPWDLWGWFG
ncbi:MAG: HNH endonuclease [Gammaproteobacteria bacterium]